MTDEKLMECSASATGIYIRIMCIMHKSDKYGTVLLKQRDKQTDNQILNFACKVAKQLPFSIDEIKKAINELVDEKVLHIDGDILYQKRMVKDDNISEKRSKAGKLGGDKNPFAQAKEQAKVQANPEYEYEDESNKDGMVFNFEKLKIEFSNSFTIIENCRRLYKLSETRVNGYFEQFLQEQAVKDNMIRTFSDLKMHFGSWLKLEVLKKPQEQTKPQPSGKALPVNASIE